MITIGFSSHSLAPVASGSMNVQMSVLHLPPPLATQTHWTYDIG